MGFKPISVAEYARLHVKANPRDKAGPFIKRLEEALQAYKAGERCACGQPIWVIGSAVAHHACFTCITGEADPSDDYEIDQALEVQRKHHRRNVKPPRQSSK